MSEHRSETAHIGAATGRGAGQAPSALGRRLQVLDALLNEFTPLWKAQPYKQPRPGWCDAYPDLADHVLSLDDVAVECLAGDDAALIDLVSRHLPQASALHDLTDFPPAAALPRPSSARQFPVAHFDWEIPGRKRAQIEAFAGAAGPARASLLEWCAGKGHLGRLYALSESVQVLSLEYDATLCQEGQRLARRARAIAQRFVVADALRDDSAALVAGRHCMALHACGDLHVALVKASLRHGARALDLAPCCYHKSEAEISNSLSGEGSLHLTRDDLRLAASNVATASARVRMLRRRAAMWKLGYAQVFAGHARASGAIPGEWLKHGLADFCMRMATRQGLQLPKAVDWECAESAARALQARAERLSLVRLAFRRALEAWLVLDRARTIELGGYTVTVRRFCHAGMTPRNLLISARR